MSVIVPLYNTGAVLDELVGSLLAQTMPPRDFEVIFVDDGSTDGTGERLEALAAPHHHFVVRRIPNSGWPGTPRNLGLELARGEYVAFLDHDDYLGPRGLELVHAFAVQHGSDLVVAREVGVGRNIGRFVFRQTVPDAALDRDPVLQLQTPHKVYRRSLLEQHQIRFPSGKVRLEDHQFNVRAFFAARRVSIYGDYAYYHWTRREGVANASSERFDPHDYFQVAIGTVIDTVDRSTEPGPYRDRIKAYWLGKKMLAHLSGGAMLGYAPARREQIYREVRDVALRRFAPSTRSHLEFPMRVRDHLLREDRLPDLLALAQAEQGLGPQLVVEEVAGTATAVVVRFTMELRYPDGSPLAFTGAGGTVSWVPPVDLGPVPADVLDVSRDLVDARLHLLLKRRDQPEDHSVCAVGRPRLVAADDGTHRVVFAGEARVTAQDLAGLPGAAGPVVVDVSAELDALGRRSVRRLPVPAGALPADGDVGWYRTKLGNLSVRVTGAGVDVRPATCSPAAHGVER